MCESRNSHYIVVLKLSSSGFIVSIMSLCPVTGCHGLHDPIGGTVDPRFSWASATRCSVCYCQGYVCGAGCLLRRAFVGRKQLSDHNTRKHASTAMLTTNVSWFGDVTNDDNSEDTDLVCPVPAVSFSSKGLQIFLDNTIKVGMISAIRHFVCGACFGSRTVPLEIINTVPVHDTYIVLLTARLVFRIGSVHQVLLCSLLSVLVQARPQLGSSSLPITRAQMISAITNITKRSSIAAAIPTPRPIELGQRHAYLSLKDAIGHALGLQPAKCIILDKYQRLMNSAEGRNCLMSAKGAFAMAQPNGLQQIVCCLTFWFDGWDPNSSLTKANKSPIWSGTVTLIFATLEGSVRFVTTRLVASGPGKADHTEVIQSLYDSTRALQTQCCSHKFWKRESSIYVLVYPSVLLITCDQPERRYLAGLLAGNSKLHACFGVSCNTAALTKNLEACTICIVAINRYIDQKAFTTRFSKPCDVCLQWNLPSVSGQQTEYSYQHPLESDFPDDAVSGAYFNTHAGIVSMSILKQAWDEAFQKWVLDRTWTQKQVEVYFKVLTINDATVARFVDQGRRCQLAEAYRNNPNTVTDEEICRDLKERLRDRPEDYVKPCAPPMWSWAEMHQLPEAVMHLTMGVVKSVAKFVHHWAASRNKSPYLAERMNFCINMHRQYCRIGRCPMATYSPLGKFPGWVADTFRSWWIWMPWLYSTLDSSTFCYQRYVLPDKPTHRWNGKEAKLFLKSRAYPGYTKLTAQASKDVVATMVLEPNWPPPEVVPSGCSVSVEQLQVLVWHCHALFKNMFAEPHQPSHQHAAEVHAKMLLTTIAMLDRLMNPGENMTNIYERKYNFISLPRAVALLPVYGSARNIQEGGLDGEGIVKMLRPLTPRGLKQHFARNLMDAFHRDQQLQEHCDEVRDHVTMLHTCTENERADMNRLAALEDAELNGSNDEGAPTLMEDEDDIAMEGIFAMDQQQFKKYKTLDCLKEYHTLGLPLSFVMADVHGTCQLGCVVGTGLEGKLIPLRVGRVAMTSSVGFPYFSIHIETDMQRSIPLYCRLNLDEKAIQHHRLVNYGHLLPHLATLEAVDNTTSPPYAIITTDGNHLDSLYTFI
jgi:hypothetical protein